MSSPRAFISKLKCISPRPLQSLSNTSTLDPRTSIINNALKRNTDGNDRLASFNINTPNRRKILQNGILPEQRVILGTGGFGTVYKASYKGVQVAAKIMQKSEYSDELLNSEKHASLLTHSNIIKILNIEEGEALSLITMELCSKTLEDYIEEVRLDNVQRVRIWRDVSYALQFCHSEGVVHADVKPTNILMGKHGQPKLTDFGSSIRTNELATPIKSDVGICRRLTFSFCTNGITTFQIIRGTPGYASPEVLRGNIPTTAADIYSLGIIAWQMLSKTPPFKGLHVHTIIYLTATGTRPRDDELRDNFNDRYKSLYRQSWSQRMEDRPSINQLIDKLSTLLKE